MSRSGTPNLGHVRNVHTNFTCAAIDWSFDLDLETVIFLALKWQWMGQTWFSKCFGKNRRSCTKQLQCVDICIICFQHEYFHIFPWLLIWSFSARKSQNVSRRSSRGTSELPVKEMWETMVVLSTFGHDLFCRPWINCLSLAQDRPYSISSFRSFFWAPSNPTQSRCGHLRASFRNALEHVTISL